MLSVVYINILFFLRLLRCSFLSFFVISGPVFYSEKLKIKIFSCWFYFILLVCIIILNFFIYLLLVLFMFIVFSKIRKSQFWNHKVTNFTFHLIQSSPFILFYQKPIFALATSHGLPHNSLPISNFIINLYHISHVIHCLHKRRNIFKFQI